VQRNPACGFCASCLIQVNAISLSICDQAIARRRVVNRQPKEAVPQATQ
jgi:hypothetical protein